MCWVAAAVAILASFPFIGYLGNPRDRSREESVIRRWKIMPKRTLILAAIALSFIAARTTIAADHSSSAIGPSEALKLILEGNDRFVAGKLKHPHQAPSRRDEIAKGQHPFASILACSDSRTAPEILFDRGLGDLFIVRVAGNVADQVVIESLDYSVTHLGARLVIVLGHTRCGAVTAAVQGHDGPGDVGPMLKELRPAVAASKGRPGDPVENAIRANVKLVVEKLVKSPELAATVKSGELKILGAIYDLDTGKITMLPD
jgi:carbonic anhydrase